MTSPLSFISFITLLMLALLGGCTAPPASLHTQPTHHSSSYYLSLAHQADPSNQPLYLLQAADRLIEENQAHQAQAVLDQINQALPLQLVLKSKLVAAQLLLAQRRTQSALQTLEAVRHGPLNFTCTPPTTRTSLIINNDNQETAWSDTNCAQWHGLMANAYEQWGDINSSLQERSDRLRYLRSPAERNASLLATWQAIEATDMTQLQMLMAQADTDLIRGWLSLALIANTADWRSATLNQQLQAWQTHYPTHPAQALLPSSLSPLNALTTRQAAPQHIALLIPLTGDYAVASHAILNGFLAAYYEDMNRPFLSQPNPPRVPPQISIIDTSRTDITSAYHAALNQSADRVIGPLTKTNILTLIHSTRLTVPTLVLNTLPNTDQSLTRQRYPNLYQFGLSATDEAQQAAIMAWKSDTHPHNSIIIAPAGAWGTAIASAFKTSWLSLGGHITDQLTYTSLDKLPSDIQHLLRIDESNERATLLEHILHEPCDYKPRRRTDVDLLFMVALPETARQIRPLLNYYYANDIPIYTTSHIAVPHSRMEHNHDLDGIHCPDMPWTLHPTRLPDPLHTIQQQLQALWPKRYAQQPRLFALGVDAYYATYNLNKMKILPYFGIPAATGRLYLRPDHHIYRQLSWSTLHQ